MQIHKKKHTISIASIILLMLVVGISIGYAALSTTLNITGSSAISKQTWDVHFENIAVITGSSTATKEATITEENTTEITYTVALSKPGDFYEFTVDVVNAGTIGAKLYAEPTLSGVSTAQDVYTNYTVKWSDNTAITANDKLGAGQSKKINVRVEYDNNITASQLPTTEQTLNLTFAMNYVQD